MHLPEQPASAYTSYLYYSTVVKVDRFGTYHTINQILFQDNILYRGVALGIAYFQGCFNIGPEQGQS